MNATSIDPAAPTLEFDPNGSYPNRYRLGLRPLESVTEVLRGVGIMDIEYVAEKALSRGRAVHAGSHLMDIEALSVDAFLDRYDFHPDLHGYLRAWERCKLETRMEILDSEQSRYHKTLLFAGTRDKRALVPAWRNRIYKLDLKTVGVVGAPGPKWAAEQLAAYELLEPGTPVPDRRASIILYPDGSWRPEFHDEYSDAACFVSYLTTYRKLKFHGRI